MTTDTLRRSKLDDLLEKTSRTFALAIPLLPEPRRTEVTVAYLLFRIADTFEDAARWPRDRRIHALHAFVELLEAPDAATAERLGRAWRAEVPIRHGGYLELLGATPLVLDTFRSLDPAARSLVGEHSRRTAIGMAEFVARTDDAGALRLEDIADLRQYCYVVAGIVGEMLTELFLLEGGALSDAAPELRRRARYFGEGLQLVNILKDSADDAREGRLYLPGGVERETIFELAFRDLDAAAEYTRVLQAAGAADGLVEFNALPVRLALATLERVREAGPGAKISRAQVFRIVTETRRAIAMDRPAVPVPSGRAWRDA